ncbi:hypothetical protein BKA83DRAFT_4490280 [Pisolithus microcarpus]|nr:hypothetical protein BKA83DRAFT_4490280 [Pisolithus microcarpus]
MEHWGSLPQLLHMTLKEYHMEDSLTYEEVIFDLGTNTKLAQWIRKAGRLGAKLAARDFRRKIIFVMVHSEVNRGDLFAGKNEGGEDVATMIEDFIHYVFAPPLHKLVYASTLFILTCGHLVAFEESFMAMKQAITRLRPEYTILFTTPDFISAVTKMFMVAYSIQVLVQGHTFHEILLDLLNVSLDLRMHTDVLLIHISGLRPPKPPFGSRTHTPIAALSPSIIGYRYSWYHSHRRPWSNSLPIGCPGCGAIRSWSQSKHNLEGKHAKARVTSCLACGRKVFSEPLQGEYQLQGNKVSGWKIRLFSHATMLEDVYPVIVPLIGQCYTLSAAPLSSHQALKKDKFYALLEAANLGVITLLCNIMNTTSTEFAIAPDRTRVALGVD